MFSDKFGSNEKLFEQPNRRNLTPLLSFVRYTARHNCSLGMVLLRFLERIDNDTLVSSFYISSIRPFTVIDSTFAIRKTHAACTTIIIIVATACSQCASCVVTKPTDGWTVLQGSYCSDTRNAARPNVETSRHYTRIIFHINFTGV